VGVDIFYPESESPGADRALADTFRENRSRMVVALACEVAPGRAFDGEVAEPLYDAAIAKIREVKQVRPVEAWRVLLPAAPIGDAATFGHVYSLPDRDGKLRWETLYLKYGDEYLPSFALQVARVALGIPATATTIVGGSGVRLGEGLIPTDDFGRLHINYLGKEGSFPTVSAAEILAGRSGPDAFRDKVVLVGATAIATYDLKTTPLSANMTGVEKNATVVANILRGNFLTRAPLFVDVLVVLVTGLAAAFLLRRGRARSSFIVLGLLVVLLVAGNQTAFAAAGLRMNLTYPLLTLLTEGAYIVGVRYLLEERRAREIRRLFSSFVSERVVNELIRNPELAHVGGQRREVTVLFSDVQGFTAYSEVHPPEEVVRVLNVYLEAMTDVILSWEGTLDKFVGDGIVAFWGAPLRQANHAELAVRCALHMRKRLGEMKAEWERAGRKPFELGIGINTGEVLVGNIGAEGRKMDYTVIGDHVNLASRIEGLTRPYRAGILITRHTLRRIRDLVATGRIGHVSIRGLATEKVKGREEPIGFYEVSAFPHGDPSLVIEVPDVAPTTMDRGGAM
jgi:adenylate cyclase